MPESQTSTRYRVDRAKLHALVEGMSDVIEARPLPDDLTLDLPPALRDELAAILPGLDEERLWVVSGVAVLIGLNVYEECGQFVVEREESS